MKQITFLVVIITLLTTQQLFAQKQKNCNKTKEGRAEEFYYSGSMLDEAVKQKTVFDILNQSGNMSEAMAWVIAINHYDELFIEEQTPKYKIKKINLKKISEGGDFYNITLNENEVWNNKQNKNSSEIIKIIPTKNIEICMDKIEGKNNYRDYYYNTFFSNLKFVLLFNDNIDLKNIELAGAILPTMKNEIKYDIISKIRETILNGSFEQIITNKLGDVIMPISENNESSFFDLIFDKYKYAPSYKTAFFSGANYCIDISLEHLKINYKENMWTITDAIFSFKVIDMANNNIITYTSKTNYKTSYSSNREYKPLIATILYTDIYKQFNNELLFNTNVSASNSFFPTFYKLLAIETRTGFDVNIYIKTKQLKNKEIDYIIKELEKKNSFEYQESILINKYESIYYIPISQCKFDVSEFQTNLLELIQQKYSLKLQTKQSPYRFMYFEDEDN